MQNIFIKFRRFSSAKDRLNSLLFKMPKDTQNHVERSQKQRIKIKEKSKFYSPGIVNIQVLGNGAKGGASSIYIFSEQSRYLFNCSEGTQRLATEHKTRLTRMEHLFLTRKTWNRFGGVPGLCLTMQDFGVPKINLHGPPGIREIFEATKRFVVLKFMQVETPNCTENETFEDSVMKVLYVPLKQQQKESEKVERMDDETRKLLNDDTDYYGYEEKNGNRSRKRSPDIDYSQVEPENSVMSYICKLRERPGHLMLEKCLEFGVPKGPLLGMLKNGFDVTLFDGRIVKADDVRDATMPGFVFIFIDIPDESYLESLKNSKAFEPYQSTAVNEDDIAMVVFHFTPQNIIENPIYREFMGKFSEKTRHLLVNETNRTSGFFSAHRGQRRLNVLDENVFPLLKEINPFTKNLPLPAGIKISDLKLEVPTEESKEFPELFTMTSFHLRPTQKFDRSLEPFYSPEKLMEENFEVSPELSEAIEKFKIDAQKLICSRSAEERSQEFPRIITLGTGSCIPNKARNVSANLIWLSADSCVLLDCGEGTLGQICRFYGEEEFKKVLKNLKMIYISHLHADHHLGLINILDKRRQLTSEKVLILAPFQMNAWLTFYNFCIEKISDSFDLYSNTNFLEWKIDKNQKSSILERLNLVDLMMCRVEHCPNSFGITLEMKNSMKSEIFPNETVKITYSGDTMPCRELVSLGMNSDVLIHEATMEDELVEEARIKMHSTTSQAIEIGEKMNAKFLILTHFSQRYAKIPLMKNVNTKIAVAFDNMEVTLNDLPMMHLMYEPMKLMFSEHFEMMEKKTAKRKFHQELKELHQKSKRVQELVEK